MHTGSVFCAEQDWTGYTSDFLVYPVNKCVFSPKKHFEVALTPNKLTDCYEILGEEKYAFFSTCMQNFSKIGRVEAEILPFKV